MYLVSRNDLDEDKDMAETTPPVSNKMAANSHDWSFWSGVILSQPAGGQVRQTPLYLIGNGVTPLQFLRARGTRGLTPNSSKTLALSMTYGGAGMDDWLPQDNHSSLTIAGGESRLGGLCSRKLDRRET